MWPSYATWVWTNLRFCLQWALGSEYVLLPSFSFPLSCDVLSFCSCWPMKQFWLCFPCNVGWGYCLWFAHLATNVQPISGLLYAERSWLYFVLIMLQSETLSVGSVTLGLACDVQPFQDTNAAGIPFHSPSLDWPNGTPSLGCGHVLQVTTLSKNPQHAGLLQNFVGCDFQCTV